MESSWKTQKESLIPKSNPKNQAIVTSTATAATGASTSAGLSAGMDVSNGSNSGPMAVKDTLRQIHVLFTEMAR